MLNPRPPKKLLMFGWHMPTAAYVHENLSKLESHSLDGVCIKLPPAAGGGDVFDIKQWRAVPQAARDAEMATLTAMPRSQVLTDNFLVLYGASTMDWFSDSDWESVLEHSRFAARGARASGCKGVCWDAEPYHDINPWRFVGLPTHEQHNWAEHAAIARKRGAQFMQALEEGFPGLTVFALRLLSDFADGSPFAQGVLPIQDPKTQQEKLESCWWSLHASFINGMLSAASPAVTLVDGNEEAYYYTSALEFYRMYITLSQDTLMLVEPALQTRYRAQYRVGHAVPMNYLIGAWAGLLNGFPDWMTKQALELTEAQRAQWFEHNIYHGLASADEYVWIYTEQQNLWTGEEVPPGFMEAMASAKRKQAAGEPLGFVVEQMLLDAQARVKT